MPVLIVDADSDPREGMINKDKMDNGILNFQEKVSLTTLDGSFTVIKKHACSYAKDEILSLLGVDPDTLTAENMTNSDITGLKIYFGVQPVLGNDPDMLACDGSNYSNMADTMIFATVQNGAELRNINDLMLIPGFKSYGHNLGAGGCCGSMSGGNG